MLCTLAAVVLAGGLGVRSATGAGLSIAWLDCRPPLGAGFTNQAFGCNSDIQKFPFFPSFSVPASMDSVFSMELVVDFDVAADPLPVWWQMAPGCRTNGWAADGTPSAS